MSDEKQQGAENMRTADVITAADSEQPGHANPPTAGNTEQQQALRSTEQPTDESGMSKDDPSRAPESGTP